MEQMSQSRNWVRKGQVTMLDLVAAISIFTLIIAILYGSWQNKIDTSAQQLQEFRASSAAQRAMNAITHSAGLPSNWAVQGLSPNSDSLKGVGVADSPNVLDEYKLSILEGYYNSETYYNNSRLKMGISPFHSDIKISYMNQTQIMLLGNPPQSGDTIRASLQKVAVYKNDSVLVRVRVWE